MRQSGASLEATDYPFFIVVASLLRARRREAKNRCPFFARCSDQFEWIEKKEIDEDG